MAIQYSIQKMVSDGTLSTIALGIQYLQRNDIYIRIAGVETPQSGAPSGYTWAFIDNTTLQVLPVVPNGVEVVIYRRTDVDAMYNIYSQNAQFDEATIDENNQQLLYIAQEYFEQGIPGAGVESVEFVRDDGALIYYRIRLTDGSYTPEFAIPRFGDSEHGFIREVDSIAGLIAIESPVEGDLVVVQSYHNLPFSNVLALPPAGGGQYRWSQSTPKNAHNGGYIIDPDKPFPTLATFNTYYSSTSAGTGCWVRVSDRIEINTAEFGMLNSNNMVWNCAAFMAAFKFSMKKETGQLPKYKKLSIPSGIYKTTNPIIVSDIDGYGILPSVVGGDGSLGSVVFNKTTTNTTGAGYVAGDVDAVYMVSPTSSFGDYLFGEKIRGITFDRDSVDVGYAYLARKSAMAQRGNLICRDSLYNFYADDCWMTEYGEVWARLGVNGISVLGGTSCTGGTLYANECSGKGFDFRGLTYSHLMCACDLCGTGSADGNIAYDFTLAKSVTGNFNTEYHKGTEFLFSNTEGAVISGRSFRATAVANSATRILNTSASVVKFVGYNWGAESFSNLSPTDKAKYTFKSISPLSSIAFDSCVLPPFPAEGVITQLDDLTFPESISVSNYSDCSGVINRLVSISDTMYRRLGYIGDAVSVMLVSAICKSSSFVTRTYEAITPTTLTHSRLVAKSTISTSSGSPTNLYQLYTGGSPVSGQFLVGYVDTDGWLWVKHSAPGNNVPYRFVIHK